MDFYNRKYFEHKSMNLYDCVEPLQQPIGFVHFKDSPISEYVQPVIYTEGQQRVMQCS